MEQVGADSLERFLRGLFGCLRRWGDALFELTDAVLCAPGALHSVPSLSLEPEFRRSHGSLYGCPIGHEALPGGRRLGHTRRSSKVVPS